MDSIPSTPASSSRSTTTPRHLKRLSLSSHGSPFSPGSPSSPLSTSSPSGSQGSPSLSRSDSARRRGLRLSMSGSALLSASHSSHAGQPSTSTNPSSTEAHNSPAQARSAGAAYHASPIRTESPSRTPTSAHARRTSSISYSKSPTIGALAAGSGSPDPAFPAAAGSPNPNTLKSARVSLESGRPRPSLDQLPEKDEDEAEPNIEADQTQEQRTRAASIEEPINLANASALGFVSAQSTLTEQNADLLSFIAKKERKCLDLREELKRHESELALLKRKWESIIARSFERQQSSSASPAPRHAASQSISTVSTASPNTSPTPRSAVLHPATAAHSLDLSLLSNTFDTSERLADSNGRSAGIGEPPIEIPESVKAAGNWLGGALGRVLEAAVGMPPPSEPPQEHEALEGRRREREGAVAPLESLREEDEEEEEEGQDGSDRKSASRASSTASDRTRTSGDKASTAPSSVVGDDNLRAPQQDGGKFSPSSSSGRSFPTEAQASRTSFPPPASSSLAPPSTSPSHGRTLSSLASFSDGWSSINKRWTNLTESETFKNSKRATMGLVDTFEQGLAQALAPLEPPNLSPTLERTRRRSSSISSPFLASTLGASSAGNSPNPQRSEQDDRPSPRVNQIPISPMPGQALSSMFASWSNSTNPSKGKEPERERKDDRSKAKAQNGFDWSAFQDQDKADDVEEWPAW
ncbi:uncharacterized protein JCM15063_004472 [Sporobolomyces koalae]|uniref:uncharacterized protein n=1 Tax=Sporobolomyces koalae TaxID=500713 RepID=UPI00316DCC2C